MNGWPLDDQAEWDRAESDFHHRLDIHDDADTALYEREGDEDADAYGEIAA